MGDDSLNRQIPIKNSIRLKRTCVTPEADDGLRILVDRLWPRGISKSQLQLDAWAKDLAPSTELRQWFDHEAAKWLEFKKRYYDELSKQSEQIAKLFAQAKNQRITLIYAARDERYNNAVALKEYLEQIDEVLAGKESV